MSSGPSTPPGGGGFGQGVSVLSLGFYIASSVLGGLGIGVLIDRAAATHAGAPIGLLVGLFLGLHKTYSVVKSAIRKSK